MNVERNCPLYGSLPTLFVDVFSEGDEVIERSFVNQQCTNRKCKLPCNLWAIIAEQRAEIERLRRTIRSLCPPLVVSQANNAL